MDYGEKSVPEAIKVSGKRFSKKWSPVERSDDESSGDGRGLEEFSHVCSECGPSIYGRSVGSMGKYFSGVADEA